MDIRIDSVFSLSVHDDTDVPFKRQKKKTKMGTDKPKKHFTLASDCYVALERLNLENKQNVSFRKWMMHHRHCDSSCATKKPIISITTKSHNDKEFRHIGRITRKRMSDLRQDNSCSPEKKLKIKTDKSVTKPNQQSPLVNKAETRNAASSKLHLKIVDSQKGLDQKKTGQNPAAHQTLGNSRKEAVIESVKPFILRKFQKEKVRNENRSLCVTIPKETSMSSSGLIKKIKIEPVEQPQSNIPIVVQSLESKPSIFDKEEEGTFQGLLQKLALAPKDERAAYLKRLNTTIHTSSHRETPSTTKGTKSSSLMNKSTEPKVPSDMSNPIKLEQDMNKMISFSKPSLTQHGTRIAPKECQPVKVSTSTELTNTSKTIASFRLVKLDGIPYILPTDTVNESQTQSSKSATKKHVKVSGSKQVILSGCTESQLKTDVRPHSSWSTFTPMTSVTSSLANKVKDMSQCRTAFQVLRNDQTSAIIPFSSPEGNQGVKTISHSDSLKSTSNNVIGSTSVNKVKSVAMKSTPQLTVNSVNLKTTGTNLPYGTSCKNGLDGQTSAKPFIQNGNTLFQDSSSRQETPICAVSSSQVTTNSSINPNASSNHQKQVVMPMMVNGTIQNLLFNVLENGNLSLATVSEPCRDPCVSSTKIPLVNNMCLPSNQIPDMNIASSKLQSTKNEATVLQPEIASVSTLIQNAVTGQLNQLRSLNANQNNTQNGTPLINIVNSTTKPVVLNPGTTNIHPTGQGNISDHNLLNHLLTQTGHLSSNCQPILLTNSQLPAVTNHIVGGNILSNQVPTGLLVPQLAQPRSGTLNLPDGHGNSLNTNTNLMVIQSNNFGLPGQQVVSNLVVPATSTNQSNSVELTKENNIGLTMPTNQIFIPIQLDNSNKKAQVGQIGTGSVIVQPQQLNASLFVPNKDGAIAGKQNVSSNLLFPLVQPNIPETMTLIGQQKDGKPNLTVPKAVAPSRGILSKSIRSTTSTASQHAVVINSTSNINRPGSSGLQNCSPVHVGSSNSTVLTNIPRVAVDAVESNSKSTEMYSSTQKYSPSKLFKRAVKSKEYSRQLTPLKEHTQNVKLLMTNNQGIINNMSNTVTSSSALTPMQILLQSPTVQSNIGQIQQSAILTQEIPIIIPVENVMQVNETNTPCASSMLSTFKKQHESKLIPARGYSKSASNVHLQQIPVNRRPIFANQSLSSSQTSTIQTSHKATEILEKRNKRKPQVVVRVDPDIVDITDEVESLEKVCSSRAPSYILPTELPTQTPDLESTIVEKGLRVPAHIVQQLQTQRLPDLQRKQASVESTVQKLLQNKLSNV